MKENGCLDSKKDMPQWLPDENKCAGVWTLSMGRGICQPPSRRMGTWRAKQVTSVHAGGMDNSTFWSHEP